MPDIESLMQLWPGKKSMLKSTPFLPKKINKVLSFCNMLDIAIHQLNANKGIIKALHVIFTIYSEFKDNEHFHKVRLRML